VLFSSTIEDQYRALWILQASKNFLAILVSLTSFLLNTCLAIDLILMLRYPFANKSKNIPTYVVVSISIALVLTVSWYFTLHYEKFPDGDTWPVPSIVIRYSVLGVLVMFFTSSILSILYTLKHLCATGISKHSRRTVVIRHVLSIFGFVLGQIYMLLCFASMFNLTPDSGGDHVYEIFFQVSCLLFSAQGIYVPVLRLSEKYFYMVVSKNVYDLY
jgi:hypothetical protein